MQPGWYSHFQNPGAVAYFDGEAWGTVRDGFALSRDVQKIITPLNPVHPGPRAPFESLAVPTAPKRKPMSGPRAPQSGSGWWWGIGGGALLVVWGIMSGFSPAGANCGAPFKKSSVAEYMDALSQDNGLGSMGYAAECRADIASATVWVWVLILLGVLIVLASAIIMAVLRSGHTPRQVGPIQTPASQIEDLARLRDKGLVTPEEFERKKQELLRLF